MHTVRSTLWIVALALCGTFSTPAVGAAWNGVVPEDVPVGVAFPVAVPSPSGSKPGAAVEVRISIDGREREQTVAQFEPPQPHDGAPGRLWFTVTLRAEDRGKPIRVETGRGAEREAAYRSTLKDPMFHVTAGDRPILSYWHGKENPNDKPPYNSFIHPIVGLDGEVITDVHPIDHLHHRGLYWAWVRHEQNGKLIGNWWMPQNIRLEPGEFQSEDGPLFTRWSARHLWMNQPKDSEGKPFVEEWITCRVFKTSEAGRALDVDLILTAVDDGIRIGGTLELDKGYGGLTFRYNQATDVQIVAKNGGIIEKDLNHLRTAWADWTGHFKTEDGGERPHRSGAAVLVHPSHPDFPPEWITRKYGVLNVSYPGLNLLDLPKGKPLHLRYRMWIHRGDAKQGRVDEAWRGYAADFKWSAGG